MNGYSAGLFTAIGAVMELAARTGLSWLHELSSDQALWLCVMGAVQLGLGLNYMIRLHLLPLVRRLRSLAAVPSGAAPAYPLATAAVVAAGKY